ncbi:MAG: hypothetical protein NZ553_05690 [Caldilinea sp.]|nr:hypothetical protein [Caldilinea sp.]MDW8439950.1 hypothetical protein [Caldilineaceae bacterium]
MCFLNLAPMSMKIAQRHHRGAALGEKQGVARTPNTLLLVLCLLFAAIVWNPSRASASPPPENWGCRTVYPIRIQRDSIFWNYWEYAGAMASGKIRFWKHYYVVYNHPNWVMQYVHTDSVFCP